MAISSVTMVITGASHGWSPSPSKSSTWVANCEPKVLSPNDTTIATPRPASDPRSLRVATTKLSTVDLSSSNSGRQIALVALRRLPIQPMPEYNAISRPTMPTPSGLATTLSISAGDRCGELGGQQARRPGSPVRSSSSWLLPQHDAADREADHQDRHQGQEREVRHRAGELAAQPVAVPGDRRDQVLDALVRRDALAAQHQPPDQRRVLGTGDGAFVVTARARTAPALVESAMGPPVSGCASMSGVRR